VVTFDDVSIAVADGRGGERDVFSGLSFNLAGGVLLGLVGPNGSGKSTILDVVRGLRSPTSGQVTLGIDGQAIAHMPQDYRLALFPWLRFDTHRLIYSGFPVGFDTRIFHSAVEEFELSALAGQRVLRLSGGEQQLLLLACVVACRASAYLLDEPFTAVDGDRRDRALSFVKDIFRKRSASAMIVTHSAVEAKVLADELIVFGADKSHPRIYDRGDGGPFLKAIERATHN
jgi:ABC-type nitrate/sulfonate/bicarbonate transport system ATPase subunit